MRVGIVALLQESNTFLSGRTTLAHFAQDLLLEGAAVEQQLAAAHHEVGGFFAGLKSVGVEAVPIFAARALPFGVMTAETLTQLLARMDAAIDRAGKLDGLLVAPHGATVSEQIADVDGHWLTRLRQRFGARLPIIGTLDPHGNLSQAMVDACDALTSYRTNPHLDQRQRGDEAAQLMARTLRGEIHPVEAAAFPPLAINIVAQHTAESPCRPLYELAEAMRARPGVLSTSIMLGFPYADVPEMGAAVIVVTDGDKDLARRLANELAAAWWQNREAFAPRLLSVDEAVAKAASLAGPVCLLDMGDNVGGGSPGDGTILAHALDAARVCPAFVCLADADAAARASAAGVGARLQLAMGGKSDRMHGDPLQATVTVRSLSDGRFAESEARHGGFVSFDQGPTAVVETDAGLTVMLTTKRMVPFSIRQLTSAGLEPARFRVLVAKGVNAPLAAYAPVSRHLLKVDTPGVTSADLGRLAYHRRRRPMFPFERDATYAPAV